VVFVAFEYKAHRRSIATP